MIRTPRGERVHIGIFGIRNSGKSSLINALTGQETALVSSVPGTTADPVAKGCEMRPLGPCLMIDTAGLDDEGDFGRMKVRRTMDVLKGVDLSILVFDAAEGLTPFERPFIEEAKRRGIPCIAAVNKVDLSPADGIIPFLQEEGVPYTLTSALLGKGVKELAEMINEILLPEKGGVSLVEGLIKERGVAILVSPLDSEAPKGRLKLPQVQAIRQILDRNGIAVVCKEEELPEILDRHGMMPDIVLTESQVFKRVSELVPPEIPLTSLSILYARCKGDLETLLQGASSLNSLQGGDLVLVSEACTHHPTSDDTGRVKIPDLLETRVGAGLRFNFTAGKEFRIPDPAPALIVHCGGCMLSRGEMMGRIRGARESGIPITNYGIAIAELTGILERALTPLLEE